jgi:Hint domain
MATDIFKTYSFTETLANSEKVSGTFVVDYTYASATSEAPSGARIINENIVSSGAKNFMDATFNQSTITATVSEAGHNGIETIAFSTSNGIGSQAFNMTFTDSYAAGTGSGGTTYAEFLGGTSSGPETITITSSSETGYFGTSSSASSSTIICYAKGTRISTGSSSTVVEKLQQGDLVLTLSGELEPVKWVGHRTVDCKRHPDSNEANPVRILKDAFAENQPSRDLFLSPLHSVYVNGIFVPAIDLVNDLTIFQEERSKITYYHIELANHNVIYAEGMTAETYLDDNNRNFFVSNADSEVVQLTPSMPQMSSDEIWQNKGFAKVIREGAQVDAIRAQLLERAILVLETVDQKAA